MAYRPPYKINDEMRRLTNQINRITGQLEGYQLLIGNVQLRRKNKIRSLHSSLAIEGNSLTEEQITAILEGKRVLGPPKDILEVTNAIEVYNQVPEYDPFSEDDLLSVHGRLMNGLIPDAGKYRNSGVGVLDGDKVIHIAPPARQVPRLMGNLFDYLINFEEEILIKSCVFHYEFEFIHPFSDGNGRMGRLWQTVILKSEYPDLAFVPIESAVHARQQAYYDALRQSQHDADSNAFILYSLRTVRDAVQELLNDETVPDLNWEDRLAGFREKRSSDQPFTRKEYSSFYKRIGDATATRDLRKGVDAGILKQTGKMRTVKYSYI